MRRLARRSGRWTGTPSGRLQRAPTTRRTCCPSPIRSRHSTVLYAEVLKAAPSDEDWKALLPDAASIAASSLNDAQQVAAWSELRKQPDADSRDRFKTLLPLVKDVPLTVRACTVLGQPSAEPADDRMKAVETLVKSGGAATGSRRPRLWRRRSDRRRCAAADGPWPPT